MKPYPAQRGGIFYICICRKHHYILQCYMQNVHVAEEEIYLPHQCMVLNRRKCMTIVLTVI